MIVLNNDTYCLKECAMRQKKLVEKLYRACVDHDQEKISQLRREEFAKILRRKSKGKPFTTRWILVSV
jgi:hypothetical protein